MENLTHSLVGGLLAQTRLGKQIPYATPVLIVAANLPDIDVVSAFRGRAISLEAHRGITHSVVGIISLAVIFSAICYLILKLFHKDESSKVRAPGFGALFWPVSVALLTHPILDWTNNYGIRPWLPWSNHWYYGDIVFVADPWLWLILGGALFVIASKTKAGIAAWAILAVILSLIIWTGFAGRVSMPAGVKIAWLAGIVVIIGLRIFIKPSDCESVAQFGLSLMLVYWASMFFIHHIVVTHSSNATWFRDEPNKVSAFPLPANPITWMCVAETPTAIYQVNAFAFSGADWSRAVRLPKEATTDMIAKIDATDAGHSFLSFARSYSSIVTKNSDGLTVQLQDVRFGLAVLARFDKDSRVVSVEFGPPLGR